MDMIMLLIGIMLGVVLILALIIKFTGTSKFEYVQFNHRCKHCEDKTNGLKCFRYENQYF
jgi:hypothetical protein